MTQAEPDRAVARATRGSVSAVRQNGVRSAGADRRRPGALVVDRDQLDQQRVSIFIFVFPSGRVGRPSPPDLRQIKPLGV